MNTHKSKHTKKQADMDAKRYGIAEMTTYVCIVVPTCCRISVLKYVFIPVLLCISIFTYKYGLNDLLIQRSKSMNIKRFT